MYEKKLKIFNNSNNYETKEMRHMEYGESSPTAELIDLVEKVDSISGIFQMDEEFENAAADDIEDDLLQHLQEEEQQLLLQHERHHHHRHHRHHHHQHHPRRNLHINDRRRRRSSSHSNNNFTANNHLSLMDNGDISHDDNDVGDFTAASEFDANEQAQINRIMGYRNYPQFLIDDVNAGFPALHEIGETIDELHLIMHAHILKYSLSL